MTSTDQERIKREADFHDRIFSEEEARASAGKFYLVTNSSKNFFRNYLKANCGKQVLEYGCGPHSHVNLFAPKGASVTGIDISPVALSLRQTTAAQRNFKVFGSVMNAESLGFRNATFDLVCGTGILHHLALDACLAEISRVLKPGGSAIFLEPLGHNPVINLYRNLTPAMRSVDEHPLMVSDFEMARKYFHRLDLKYFHMSSLAAVPFRKFSWFPGLVRFLERMDNSIFNAMPWMGRHAWAVVMVMSQPRAQAC